VATTGLAFLAVRVTAGEAMKVAEGRTAIWLDDHTLLVEA
jgi:hypothetical protein